MFSPPKVESIQQPLKEGAIDELAFNQSEDEKTDKEEIVSILMEEFSHMLDDTPSISEELTAPQEGEFEKDFLLNLAESTSSNIHAKYENSEKPFDEFYSTLDERNDDDLMSEKEHKFFAMFSESEELQEENLYIDMIKENNDELNENNDKMEDQFFTMLTESDEQQDIDTNEEDSIELNGNYDTFNDEPHLYHENPSFKKEKKRKYCINKNKTYNKACLKEMDYERFIQKPPHSIDLIEKKKKTTVKMQVLLTKLETDIDIIETIDLLMPLEKILKVEWSIQSLDCKVILPSKTVFLKGECVAEIECSNKELENKIQSLKVSIPWSKTANINWLTVPDFSYSSQNEFMFESQHEHSPSFHYGSYHKFAEPIYSQLNQINFVWHQELNSKDKYLQVNGVAQLSIHFMQEQFVELDCYSK